MSNVSAVIWGILLILFVVTIIFLPVAVVFLFASTCAALMLVCGITYVIGCAVLWKEPEEFVVILTAMSIPILLLTGDALYNFVVHGKIALLP